MALKQKKAPSKKPSDASKEEPKVKTYEQAEAAELTKREQEKLSRAMLLQWFQSKKYEKLKGLQEKLISLTFSEREELKKNIIENTKKELAALKEFNKEEVSERAEKFAEALIGVADGIGNVKSIIETFEQDINDEKIFHHYIGSVSGVVGIANLRMIKSNSKVKKFLKTQPGLSEELDEAINSGDYENVKEVLLQVPYFKNQGDKIDVLLELAMERPEQATGTEGLINSAIEWVGGMPKKVLNAAKSSFKILKSKIYLPVAKQLGVDYANLRNVSGFTFSQLKERDRVFQKYKYLVERNLKRVKSDKVKSKLEKQMKYIEDVNVITEAVKKAGENHGDAIYKAYEKRLQKLVKANKISKTDAIQIINELDLSAVRVDTFLPLIRYEEEKDKDQDSNIYYIGQTMSRYRRIKRAVKFVGGDVSVRAAHGRVGIKRIFGRNTKKFKGTFKKFPNGKKLTGLFDELSGKVGKYNVSAEEIDRARRTKAYMKDVKGHDEIVRMYYEASQHASKVLSSEAQKVLNTGKELDSFFKQKNAFSHLDANRQIASNAFPKKIINSLYEGGKIPGKISANDLSKAYTKRLVDVRIARDTAQEGFAALSANIKNNVMDKFQNKWARNADIRDVKRIVQSEAADIKRYVHPGRRAMHYGKLAALPMIAVGIPLVDVVRGKSRFRDVKWDLFDAGIGFVPVAGTINDFKMMWNGRTTSGRKMGFRDRLMSGVFGVVGAVSDAAWVLGGLGGVMRAGIGSLKAGRKLAHVGKLSKSIRAVQSAEGVTMLQRIGMKIGGAFSGLSSAKRMGNIAESSAKIKALDYVSTMKKLEKVEGFKSIKNLDDAEAFARVARGEKYADAAKKYASMMKQPGGIDHFKSLSKSFGFAENAPGFTGVRRNFHKAMNFIRGTMWKAPGQAKRLKEMEKTADVYQAYKIEKVQALAKYRKAVEKGEGVKDAMKNLKAVEKKFVKHARRYAEVQEEVFSTAERLSRTSLIASKAARYFTYGGFAMGGYYLVTGKSPSVSGMYKAASYGAGKGLAALKWTKKHSTKIHRYKPPVEDIIDKAIDSRAKQKKFVEVIKSLEDSKDPKKKQKIHITCAKYWNHDFARAWAYKHKDKLDIKEILNEAKKLFIPQRKKLRRMVAKGAAKMPGVGGAGNVGGPSAG